MESGGIGSEPVVEETPASTGFSMPGLSRDTIGALYASTAATSLPANPFQGTYSELDLMCTWIKWHGVV